MVLVCIQLDACNSCQIQVTSGEKKHHCRNCGHVLCTSCADKHHIALEDVGHFSPVRVCLKCLRSRRVEQPPVSEEAMEEAASSSSSFKSVNINRSGSSKF